MKKYSRFSLLVAIIPLLLLTLALRLHVLPKATVKFMLPAVMTIGLAGLIIRWKDLLKQRALTVFQRIVYAMLFVSLMMTFVGVFLLVFHIGTSGKTIFNASIATLVIVLAMLTISVAIPILQIRKIVSAEYLWYNLLVNVLLCVFMTLILAALVLRLMHNPLAKIFFNASQASFVTFFLVLIYYIAVTRKKYQLGTVGNRIIFPDEAEDYAGSYRNKQLKININITKKNDASLLIQLNRRLPFPLNVVGRDKFTFAQAGITIVFKPDKQKFILFQHSHEFLFTKES